MSAGGKFDRTGSKLSVTLAWVVLFGLKGFKYWETSELFINYEFWLLTDASGDQNSYLLVGIFGDNAVIYLAGDKESTLI